MSDPEQKDPVEILPSAPLSPEQISPVPEELIQEEQEGSELRLYSPEKKAQAYELYLISGLNQREISMELAIPVSTISSWIQKGRWRDRKIQIEKELFEIAESKYRKFIIEEKLPTAKRHLEAAKGIEEKIKAVVDKIDTRSSQADVKLVRAAKALSDASNVSARAVSLSDKPQEREEDAKSKKVPLVVIGIQGSAPIVNVRDT